MAVRLPVTGPARNIGFWAVLGGAGLGMAFLALSPSVRAGINLAIDWAGDIMEGQGVAGAAVFFLFSALSAMLAFASSAVLVPSANLAWGQPLTFLLLWGGWVAGALAAFGIGRFAFPWVLHSRYRVKLEKYQDYASRRMDFWMVLLFCFAIPSEIPGYLFGSLHYPLGKFLVAIATAEAAYALGTVIAGETLLIDAPLLFLTVLGLFALVAVLAGWALRTARRHRRL